MKVIIYCVIYGLSLASSVMANTLPPEKSAEKRLQFLQAHAFIEAGQWQAYHAIKQDLADYPLYPYLLYKDLRKRLHRAKDADIEAFLVAYQDFPLRYRLKKAWLNQLARKKRWDKFLAFYNNEGGTKLRCLSFQARLHLNKEDKKAILHDVYNVWLSGNSQPKACDKVFLVLKQEDYLNTDNIHSRIAMAMAKNNSKLARYLSRDLNHKDKHWVNLWLQAHRRPEATLAKDDFKKDSQWTRTIAKHAIKRLSRSDAEAARELWARAAVTLTFSPLDHAELNVTTAISAAAQHHPDAYQWLSQLEEKNVTDKVRYWRINSALRHQDWQALLEAIEGLDHKEQQKERWIYWQARARQQLTTMDNEASKKTFKQLAKKASYYGFLSADILKQSYQIRSESALTDVNDNEVKKLLQIPAIHRARELFHVDMQSNARREWYLALRQLDQQQIKQAATLASSWQWHDNAILTIAKTPHRADFDIRFPLAFQTEITRHAEKRDLDTAWMFGIVRRESAFMVDAKSRVGALGLMQVMPRTARAVSRRLGLGNPHTADLISTERNLLLGSAYLRQVLDRFKGNQVLATAAYNAGPYKVATWLPEEKEMAADLWVDTVPYKETRHYLRAVMAYTTIFDWKLDNDVTTLNKRMPSIQFARNSN